MIQLPSYDAQQSISTGFEPWMPRAARSDPHYGWRSRGFASVLQQKPCVCIAFASTDTAQRLKFELASPGRHYSSAGGRAERPQSRVWGPSLRF
jgi:hypothetical protein